MSMQSISKKNALSPMFALMYEFRHTMQGIDFWEVKLPKEQNEQGNLNQKQSRQDPHGMGTVDMWIDFCQAVDNNRYAEAVGNYFRLRRLLGI